MGPRCPYCFTDLDGTEVVVRCTRCHTPHHRACFLEHGGCVTLMCGSKKSATVQGVELEARVELQVHVGPERHPFLVRGGYEFGDPRWLEVTAEPTEPAHRPQARIEVGLGGPSFTPGEEVIGQVSLFLPAPLLARAVRLVLRAQRTTPASMLPQTLIEREAVLAGFPWEGHLRALGLAVKKVLHMEDESELVRLPAGVTRWTFRFRVDPLHPVRPDDPGISVLSELMAYVDLPAATDLVGRSSLHIVRPKP